MITINMKTQTKLDNYKIIEVIKVTSRKIIYRGIRKSDLLPVIIKTLSSNYPTFQEIASLKHEYT